MDHGAWEMVKNFVFLAGGLIQDNCMHFQDVSQKRAHVKKVLDVLGEKGFQAVQVG